MKDILIFIIQLPIIILASPFILKHGWECRMITRNLKEKTKSLLSQEEQKELESLLKKKGYPYISYLVKKASELENTEREVDLVVWEKLLRISNLTKSRESIIDCSYYIERREGNKEVNLIKNPPSSEF